MSHPDPPVSFFESPDITLANQTLENIVLLLEDNRKIATNPEKLRWLSIAITEVQKASMCVNRALNM